MKKKNKIKINFQNKKYAQELLTIKNKNDLYFIEIERDLKTTKLTKI